jgi:hypothetical protein
MKHLNIVKMKSKSIWCDIPGYNGIYQVSEFGQVRSLDRMVGQKFKFQVKGKIMSLRRTKDGYLDVLLSKDGVYKRHYVHRLVAIVFKPNPNNLERVTHKNSDKTNNHVDNLIWISTGSKAKLYRGIESKEV